MEPQSGDFTLVFSDREAPNASDQFALEGRFEENGAAQVQFRRSLPTPECTSGMAGTRDG